MVNYSKYSVINSNVKIVKINGKYLIRKIIKNNVNLGVSQSFLNKLIQKYVKQIRSAEINLPEIVNYKLGNGDITYYCIPKGENILEVFDLNELVFGKGRKFLSAAIKEIGKAVLNEVNLDPHIKNFVIENNEVSFVDFSPPYIDEFFDLRMSVALDSERTIIKNNFEYFGPEYLYHHFVGDFFNIKKNISQTLTKEIYNLINQQTSIKGSF
ncbi:uncharacterized protein METZ01_LOCUS424902, partial [marine metagenome]